MPGSARAAKLKAARQAKNISQAELAHAVGLSQPVISLYESGAQGYKLTTEKYVELLDAIKRMPARKRSGRHTDAAAQARRRGDGKVSTKGMRLRLPADLAFEWESMTTDERGELVAPLLKERMRRRRSN